MEPIREEPHSLCWAEEQEIERAAPVVLRQASFSEVERVVLRALLLDKKGLSKGATSNELNEEILFSVPEPWIREPPLAPLDTMGKFGDAYQEITLTTPLLAPIPQCQFTELDEKRHSLDEELGASEATPLMRQQRTDSKYHIGLWRAYEDGVKPSVLRDLAIRKSHEEGELNEHDPSDEHIGEMIDTSKRVNLTKDKASSTPVERSDPVAANKIFRPRSEAEDRNDDAVQETAEAPSTPEDYDSTEAIADQIDEFDTVPTDAEVRAEDDDNKSDASWDDSDGGFEHYDAWQVIKDEYAKDAGFSYADEGTGDLKSIETEGEGFFRILGTSADDMDARPHVMSPPLMESLFSFVPDHLSQQNLWLKFSLVRDGASILTLREMCKDSRYTFLALETKKGDVFGSFTATPWLRTHSYFGTGESFLWKMRYNRLTPCHSLLDQAQMESEVDVYPFSGLNYYIQLCTDDKLAVGGGKLIPNESLDGMSYDTGFDILPAKALESLTRVTSDKDFGFGIAINGDLSFGTSSPCATFRNPSLSSHSGESQTFEIMNLEVWAFTPCTSAEEAERLEISKSWRTESFRDTGSWTSTSIRLHDSKKQGVSSVLQRDSLQQLWQM